jgi:hypothetical protein
MSNTDWKIPAIKYHQLHGLDKSHPIPIKIFAWWRNRVEKTYHKYKSYSDIRIIIQSFLFSLPLPFLYFHLLGWIHWFRGGLFYGPGMDPNQPISAIIFAPILETLLIFLPLLEIARAISLPRWFSYPAIFFFFESIHVQRSFFEHPFMWMTGYMFIVAYEAGRTRSLLHAILFCSIVHEAYNISCYLLNPALYPSPF